MAKKESGWLLWAAAAVILFVVLNGGIPFQGGFLGALMTVCDNHEPTTTANMTITGTTVLQKTLSVDNVTKVYNHTVQTVVISNHSFTANTFNGITVSEYKDVVKYAATNLSVSTYNTKTAMIADGTYWWFNPGMSVLYNGDELSFVLYTNKYLTCTQQDVNNTQTVQQMCVAKGAGYDAIENECVCPGEYVWSSSQGCYKPVIKTTTTSGSGSGSSTSTSTSTTTTSSPVKQSVFANWGLTPWIILGGLGVLALYYFGVERGPRRGFIQQGKLSNPFKRRR